MNSAKNNGLADKRGNATHNSLFPSVPTCASPKASARRGLRRAGKLHNSRKGFTLVELIVVLGITMMLSSVLISYNSTSREQLSLYADQMKFIGTIFRAKSLSLSPSLSSGGSSIICGYGIHVDYGAIQYSLFSCNMPQGTNCQTIASPDACDKNVISISEANSKVRFISQGGAPQLDDVLFIPPDPVTLIMSGGATSTDASVVLQTVGGSLKSNPISINSAGLVDF